MRSTCSYSNLYSHSQPLQLLVTKKGIMVFALHEELDLTELVGDFKVHIQITKETFNGIPARLFPIHNRQHHHQN
ncbi:unnamed protein product [Camellia sinensis]